MEHKKHSNENIINHLWAQYFPYWPVFLLLMAVASIGTWLYLQYQLPVYESTATLLIKDEKKGIEESKMIESLNPLSSKKIIENEIEVINSRELMKQVMQELALYSTVYKAGKWIDTPLYSSSPVMIHLKDLSFITEAKRVDFKVNLNSSTIHLNSKDYPAEQWIATPFGELKFTINKKAILSDSAFYFSITHPKKVVQDLLKRLEVSSAGKLSSVINLSFKDVLPERSEDILNTLIAVYNKAAVNDKNILAVNTLSFLDERLGYVSTDLDSIEKAMQLYRAKRGAIDLSSQGKLFLENVSQNDQKLSDVNMKLAVLSQVEQYVTSNHMRGGLVPSTLGIDDPLLTSLLEKLYNTELQYEKLRATTGENNPELTSLADQIQKIKPGVVENVRSQRRGLEATKANLYTTNGVYNKMLSALPQQERDLVEISREQNIKSAIYSFLLQKREETALSHSATVSDSRVVDKAESSFKPIGIGNKFYYGIALIVALGVGAAIIFLRENLNGKVLFRHEIEAVTNFPIIGEMVAVKKGMPVLFKQHKNSVEAEQFRLLRTSLAYLGINTKGKKILVTSTLSGEGKSYVAANLALSLALGGKRVALAEFDLSNPTLCEKLGIPESKGIADYLIGEAEPDEIIVQTHDHENLFLLPAGNLPQNPSELILKERTAAILHYLQGKFDCIIVDSAPVGLLSDGYVLAKHCDATLYVVRHGYTPKKLLERLEQNNKVNELKNIALVFNGVRSRGFIQNKYGYGYGYGYVYDQKREKRVKDREKKLLDTYDPSIT
ncbi:MAG: polysaccharide biosynthesis tyrosine autokinase [Sphingobacteriales bacterium]|nr:MAG: polysaccharide biosynthesis tyrosine autokinase [Sphingobacteriales bacterium]